MGCSRKEWRLISDYRFLTGTLVYIRKLQSESNILYLARRAIDFHNRYVSYIRAFPFYIFSLTNSFENMVKVLEIGCVFIKSGKKAASIDASGAREHAVMQQHTST